MATAAVVAIAGCSSSSGPSADSSSGTNPTAKPLKVVSVSPDTLSGTTPIVVTFRHTLASNSVLPTLSPMVPGQWVRGTTTATFTPTQSYPPSTTFTVALTQPSGAAKTLAQPASQPGSIKFAEQILARLHYLPLETKAAVPSDASAEAAAVYTPPVGKFTWRFANTPSGLVQSWTPGKPNTLLRGAVIAFQHQWQLKQDGAIGPATWKALLAADLNRAANPDKYSYVSADLYPRPQTLTVWVDGKTVLSTPVNGGVPAAPTPLGTYPIYLRYKATTMQGTNPDGTKYKDKGVPWVNYFSGGSAVHGFTRASYGFPQSVGCLELPPDTAKKVYGLVDYGTLVTVTGPFIPPPKVGKPKPPKAAKPHHGAKPTTTPTPTSSSSATPTPSPSRSRKPTS